MNDSNNKKSTILSLGSVSKTFPNGESTRTVLKELTMSLESSESVSIMGQSGCGKSTLLNLIAGLDTPDSGDICFKSRKINELSDKELAEYRNADLGFIFQSHRLLPQLSAIENVLVPCLARQHAATDAQIQRAATLLERVGLKERINASPETLSGGEKQRVAAVRALIMQPSIVLADEPTGALDKNSSDTLISLLLELCKELQFGLIIVTHDASVAAQASRSLLLEGGKLHD